MVTTTADTRTSGFISAFSRNCSAVLARNNAGMSNKRGRHLYVTETLLGGPGILVLSSSASTISATARTRVHSTFESRLTSSAGVVVTREVSSIGSTSVVVIVGSNEVSNVNARRRLLRTGRTCHRVCCSRGSSREGKTWTVTEDLGRLRTRCGGTTLPNRGTNKNENNPEVVGTNGMGGTNGAVGHVLDCLSPCGLRVMLILVYVLVSRMASLTNSCLLTPVIGGLAVRIANGRLRVSTVRGITSGVLN